MAHLVPSLEFINRFQSNLAQGESVQRSIHLVCKDQNEDFFQQIRLWLTHELNGRENPIEFKADYERALVSLLRLGLRGAPIYEQIEWLSEEMNQEFERQWKSYLESLPFQLSLPLLFLFFPAYLVLLFGPLLIQFVGEIN